MTKYSRDIISIILYLALIALLIVGGPLAIVWSINTLFPVVAIPYNFWSWLAVVILNATWMGPTAITKKD